MEPPGSLDSFYRALSRTEAKQNVTRILHYGVSPVTADSITAEYAVTASATIRQPGRACSGGSVREGLLEYSQIWEYVVGIHVDRGRDVVGGEPTPIRRSALPGNLRRGLPLGRYIGGSREISEYMPTLIEKPTTIPVPGNKRIDEYIGHVNSGTAGLSVARMQSPKGWSEPGQQPDFDEYTLVLGGMMRVEHQSGVTEVRPGQAIIAHRGEWVRYSTPDGAEYIAICLPAFSPGSVNRDPA